MNQVNQADPRPPSRSPELRSILAKTYRHQVRFIIVGSTAALAHGISLEPGDIDIVPSLDADNLARVVRLLDDVDAVPEGFGHWISKENGRRKWIDEGFSSELLAGWRPNPASLASLDHLFRTPLGNLDIVPTLAGSYDDLLPTTVERPLAGIPVKVPPISDLVERLRYSNRPKDQERLARLERLAWEQRTD